ncbi:MAG: hypothetical protein E7812_02945 [Phenylobacterium sp.]|nr:MAG: hypothetical protein E7812_02945 [Phenylobacterium sp.]
MTLPVTLSLCGLFLALGAISGWLGARPPNPHRGPRLIPYRFILVLCGAVLLYLCVHLLSLLGVRTTS